MGNFKGELPLLTFAVLLVTSIAVVRYQESAMVNPFPALVAIPEKGNLILVFKSMDSSILKNENQSIVENYLKEKAIVINRYITTYYGERLIKEPSNNPMAVVLAGFAVATQECGSISRPHTDGNIASPTTMFKQQGSTAQRPLLSVSKDLIACSQKLSH